MIESIIIFFAALLIVAAMMYFARQIKVSGERGEASALKTLIASKDELISQRDGIITDLRQQLQRKDNEVAEEIRKRTEADIALKEIRSTLDYANQKNATLQAEMARMEERVASAEKEFQQRRAIIEEMQKSSTEHFKNLAGEIFKEQTESIHNATRRNISQLLEPLKENIDSFRKRVNDAYETESRERFSLQKEIKNLIELNQNISLEARHLTQALRGDSKIQGDWGEMILERLLEMSGLQEGIHFKCQATTNEDGSKIASEDGRQLRPDVVINYPDGRCVVIDSKVSLTAYIDYVNADSTDNVAVDAAAKRHLLSVKKHIAELADKRYQDLVGDKRLDFVMMFIPNEGAYMAMMKLQPDIWQEAYEKRVLLTSPTHLIAALRMLEQLWKQDSVNKNVQEIARLSGTMLDKFTNVTLDLENINKHLKAAGDAYLQAKSRLAEGKGNIVVTAQKIVRLGAKTSKGAEINRMESSESYVADLESEANGMLSES